jgi:pimeloyl-ACP methyl ester carboxylesterase
MPFFQRGSAKIYFEVFSPEGSDRGQWVTLINGHARSSTDFKAFAKYLSGIGYSVLTPDNRGSGKTESPPFIFADMLQDVVALWKDLGIARTHLLGISYGGVISENLAASNPQTVASLVLTSTTCQSSYLNSDRRLAELPLPERMVEMANYFGSEFANRNPVLYKSLIKQMSAVFDDDVFVQKARKQRIALNLFDFRILCSSIKAPTLILHGADDRVIVPESAQGLHQLIAGSQLEIWDGIGHLFLAEAPRRFYERASDFFQSNS